MKNYQPKYLATSQRRSPEAFRQPTSAFSGGKKPVLVATAVAGTALILWLAGVWSADSPRYWRTIIQHTMLALAERTGQQVAVPLVHWSMRVHRAGMTFEELSRAAEVLDRSDRKAQAAVLWLGLANGYAAAGDKKAAIDVATRASRSSHSSGPIVALVMLHWDSEQRHIALADLVRNWPNHEIVRALLCLGDFRSFDDGVPESCGRLKWVEQRARQAWNEYARHVAELEVLPATAALKAVNAEYELAERERNLQSYAKETVELKREHDRERVKSLVKAVGEAVLPPLPADDDTVGSYLARLLFCRTPIGRYICAAKDVSEEIEAHSQYDAEWQKRANSLAELVKLTNVVVELYQKEQRDWTSSGPFDQLVAARNAILPDFRREIESQLQQRFTPIGVKPSQAIALVLDAGTDADGRLFPVLGNFRNRLSQRRNSDDLLARISSPPRRPVPSASVGGREINAKQYLSLLDTALADERSAVYRVGVSIRSGPYGGSWIYEVGPGSAASRSGIKTGDIIHAVDGLATPTYTSLQSAIALRCGGLITVTLYRPSIEAHLTVPVLTSGSFPCFGISGEDWVIDRSHPEIVAVTSSNAQRAGIMSGDLIVSADGTWINGSDDFVDALQKFARTHPAAPISLVLQRRGQEVKVSVPISRERR
jgi:PDZ domain-containing protein